METGSELSKTVSEEKHQHQRQQEKQEVKGDQFRSRAQRTGDPGLLTQTLSFSYLLGGHFHRAADPAGRHGPGLHLPDLRALLRCGDRAQQHGAPAGRYACRAAAEARGQVLPAPVR